MANTAYDQFKMHEGRRYTGMKIGRGHKWKYDADDWTEKKVTPDKWEFQYSVVKRRKGRAPEGSGAPVGTAYNWYVYNPSGSLLGSGSISTTPSSWT